MRTDDAGQLPGWGMPALVVAAAALLLPGAYLVTQGIDGTASDNDCAGWEPDPAWANARGQSMPVLVRANAGQDASLRVGNVSVEQAGVGVEEQNKTLTSYALEDPTGTFGHLVRANSGLSEAIAGAGYR